MDDDHDSARLSEDNHQLTSRPQSQNSLNDWLSVRPELTVNFKSSKSNGQDPGPPLDLSTTPSNPQEDQPPVQSASLLYSLVLKPDEHEKLAPKNPLYATYVSFLLLVFLFILLPIRQSLRLLLLFIFLHHNRHLPHHQYQRATLILIFKLCV